MVGGHSSKRSHGALASLGEHACTGRGLGKGEASEPPSRVYNDRDALLRTGEPRVEVSRARDLRV